MDSYPEPPHTSLASPLTTRARIERISEPWALNRSFAIAVTLVLAMILGSWVASGEFENLILVTVWFAAVMIIVFVQDYWWSPPLIISALSIGTTALGFPLGGLEIGVVILGLTFPMKMAMKTLRKAEPEMGPGAAYWILLGFVAVHCVVILFYNEIAGIQLRNIVKSYYQVLTPLTIYGLLIRYCHTRTVWPTVAALFFTNLVVVPISIVVLLAGIDFDPFTDLRITIGWLETNGAMFVLRSSAPLLFIGSLAFWPTIRSHRGRLCLVLGMVVGFFGTIVGSGRLPLAICLIAGVFFAVIRGKLWIALPFVVIAALISAIITAKPDLFLSFPSLIQRSIAPLNFSQQGAQLNEDLSGSDDWHKELRDRSFDYWLADTNSFWLGHGFKSWDPSIARDSNMDNVDHEHMVELAIEMGATENTFSSVTNIFGVAGLVLYGWFLLHLFWTLVRGYRLSPPGSVARALCEFSLVNLIPALLFCCYMGYVPGLNIIFWQLGVLAARPYLVPPQAAPVEAPEPPAFARPAFAVRTPGDRPRGVRRGLI